MGFLDTLSVPYRAEIEAFGPAWCGPEQYDHAVEVLVAKYKGEGDGQDVDVYCTALPARFYRIEALPGTNTVGEPVLPASLSTGSGMAQLAAKMAEAFSEGMLGAHTPTSE